MRIKADDREGLERLLRYCARPPLAAGYLQWVDERHERLLYRLPKPRAAGTTELVLTSLELLERLSAFVPPPRIHRYYGVLASNAILRPAVTALASREPVADLATPLSEARGATSRQSPLGEKPRRPSVYLWAMLLARIYELFPLLCSRCGGEVEIIAFITEEATVRAILTHLGEPDRTARLPLPWATRPGDVSRVLIGSRSSRCLGMAR